MGVVGFCQPAVVVAGEVHSSGVSPDPVVYPCLHLSSHWVVVWSVGSTAFHKLDRDKSSACCRCGQVHRQGRSGKGGPTCWCWSGCCWVACACPCQRIADHSSSDPMAPVVANTLETAPIPVHCRGGRAGWSRPCRPGAVHEPVVGSVVVVGSTR